MRARRTRASDDKAGAKRRLLAEKSEDTVEMNKVLGSQIFDNFTGFS
jgi:hypothetical protein